MIRLLRRWKCLGSHCEHVAKNGTFVKLPVPGCHDGSTLEREVILMRCCRCKAHWITNVFGDFISWVNEEDTSAKNPAC